MNALKARYLKWIMLGLALVFFLLAWNKLYKPDESAMVYIFGSLICVLAAIFWMIREPDGEP